MNEASADWWKLYGASIPVQIYRLLCTDEVAKTRDFGR